MNTAQAIVHQLLEGERVCITCQSQLGIPQQPGDSHGYCKRHALETQQVILKNAMAGGKQRLIELAQKRLAEIQAAPEEKYPPDLTKQHAAVAQ